MKTKSRHKIFRKIYVIQSYPTLTHLIDLLSKEKEKENVAVIVSLDSQIFKFLKNYFSDSNISFFLFGRAKVFRYGYYKPIRLLYTLYLIVFTPKFKANELILTYANWTDIGSLFLKKISFDRIVQFVPDTELRYQISPSENQSLNITHRLLNYYTGPFLENKDYKSNVNNKEIVHFGVGLKNLKTFGFSIRKHQLCQIESVKISSSRKYTIPTSFLLFIDKDIVTPGFISFWGYYRLMKELKMTMSIKKVDIYIKFKPRHYSWVKHLFLSILGYKIAPTEAPAQIFSFQEECLGIIGFTSSSMSLNYKKPIVSLSNLEGYFSKSMNLNAESMKQRSSGVTQIYFPKGLGDILNLIK